MFVCDAKSAKKLSERRKQGCGQEGAGLTAQGPLMHITGRRDGVCAHTLHLTVRVHKHSHSHAHAHTYSYYTQFVGLWKPGRAARFLIIFVFLYFSCVSMSEFWVVFSEMWCSHFSMEVSVQLEIITCCNRNTQIVKIIVEIKKFIRCPLNE